MRWKKHRYSTKVLHHKQSKYPTIEQLLYYTYLQRKEYIASLPIELLTSRTYQRCILISHLLCSSSLLRIHLCMLMIFLIHSSSHHHKLRMYPTIEQLLYYTYLQRTEYSASLLIELLTSRTYQHCILISHLLSSSSLLRSYLYRPMIDQLYSSSHLHKLSKYPPTVLLLYYTCRQHKDYSPSQQTIQLK